MKKIIYCLIIVTLFLTSCYSEVNSIMVKVDDNLNIDLVKIQYGFYSGNEKSDKKLVDNGLGQTVFENNKSNYFNTICGENDFLVTYSDEYYVKVRHFIPNNFTDGIPDKHNYNFKILNNTDGLLLILEIIGPDGETIKKDFSKIKDAGINIMGKKNKTL